MDQLKDHADDRLLNGCIYCGDAADTRDHIPSRCLLEPPYPENLPVAPACKQCNNSFSQDEEYLACLVEAVLCGSANPEKIRRLSVARILRHKPTLGARLTDACFEHDGKLLFEVEEHRVRNVMLKLARGHAAFELSQPCRQEPDHYWCGPISSLDQDQREAFDAPHIQQLFGELGSRGSQRMMAAQMMLQSESGKLERVEMIFNDWIEVQPDSYRYMAIDDLGGIVVRIVLSEFLACEVAWRSATN